MELHEIFEFNTYKKYLKYYLEESKRESRGNLSSLAKLLKVHPSFLSQVLKGDKDLSPEHAYKLTNILGLKDKTKDYFIYIFLEEKSSSEDLKRYFQKKSETIRTEAKRESLQSQEAKTISESVGIKFYSHVDYSLINLLTSFERFNTAEKISSSLGLPLHYVQNILDFLETHELCKKDREGYYTREFRHTHSNMKGPLAHTNHRNWRNKAFELYPQMEDDDLVFSGPMVISKQDFKELKDEILELIRKVGTRIETRKEDEVFAIFNIDWISFHEKNFQNERE